MNILVYLIGIITGNKSHLWKLSINRYSSRAYKLFDNSIIDCMLSFFAFPLFWLLIIPTTLRFKNNTRGSKVKIIFQASNKVIYSRFFSKLTANINKKNYLVIGDNLDLPNIKNDFQLIQAIYLFTLFILIWPIVLIFSIINKVNLFRSIMRTFFIYYRNLNYFNNHPCDIFFTYQDNSCSSALYLALRKSGGKKIIAFQNGIRNTHPGIDGCYFDHLFAINQASVDLYKNNGSVINNYDIIGSLVIYCNPELLEVKPQTLDLLFIDQGFPDKNLEKFMLLDTFNLDDLTRYVNDIKRLSKKFPKLNIGYQLRPYPKNLNSIVKNTYKFFNDTNVKVFEKKKDLDSYCKMQESKIIVTIDSTMGLEALSLGKVTLFTNHSSKEKFSILKNSSKLQLNCNNYKAFEEGILSAVSGSLNNEVEKNTYYAPLISRIVANDIPNSRLKEYIME